MLERLILQLFGICNRGNDTTTFIANAEKSCMGTLLTGIFKNAVELEKCH